MSSEIRITQITKDQVSRWNNLLFNSMFPSYMQSLEWEEIKLDRGRCISSFIFEQNGNDIAGVTYSIKYSKAKLFSLADIKSGILFKNPPSIDVIYKVLIHFVEWARERKVSFARIIPWLPKSISGINTEYLNLFEEAVKQVNFNAIEEGPHTYWIDLNMSEDYILNRMKRQTRYDIRHAEKADFSIQVCNNLDEDKLDIFWSFYMSRGAQRGFKIEDEIYFKQQLSTLVNSGLANVFFIHFEGKVVNVSIASNFGISAYLYGAIISDFSKLGQNASPGPLAQWAMIKNSKHNNAKVYDMGFCPGAVPMPENPMYKIWRFKYGFGGEHVQYLPTYGGIIHPLKGLIFKVIKYNIYK